MSVSLDVFNPPNCPNLCQGVCLRATSLLGSEVIVTAPVCNVTCKMHGGPYAGAVASDEIKWIKKMSRYYLSGSMRKVWKKYGQGDGIDIVVDTALVEAVKDAFFETLMLPFVDDIALTGSTLISGQQPKDLDIVLVINDYPTYLNQKTLMTWPKEVAGMTVDLFARPSPVGGLFLTLTLSDMALYHSKLYKIRTLDPAIKSVHLTGAEGYSDIDVRPARVPAEPLKGKRKGCRTCKEEPIRQVPNRPAESSIDVLTNYLP